VFICSTPETNPAIAVLCGFLSRLQCFEDRELCDLCGKVFLVWHHEREWDGKACIISLLDLNHVATQPADVDCCARPVSSPLHHEAVLRATSAHERRKHPQFSQYAALIGSLMYTASCSRPDQLPDHCSLLR
jgi:hypothetical protein